jgi:hypothetical protein
MTTFGNDQILHFLTQMWGNPPLRGTVLLSLLIKWIQHTFNQNVKLYHSEDRLSGDGWKFCTPCQSIPSSAPNFWWHQLPSFCGCGRLDPIHSVIPHSSIWILPPLISGHSLSRSRFFQLAPTFHLVSPLSPSSCPLEAFSCFYSWERESATSPLAPNRSWILKFGAWSVRGATPPFQNEHHPILTRLFLKPTLTLTLSLATLLPS